MTLNDQAARTAIAQQADLELAATGDPERTAQVLLDLIGDYSPRHLSSADVAVVAQALLDARARLAAVEALCARWDREALTGATRSLLASAYEVRRAVRGTP